MGAVPQGGKALQASKIEAAYVGFSTKLDEMRKAYVGPYQTLADVIEDDHPVNILLWLNDPPAMRLWKGQKKLSKLSGESHLIKTDPYEASLEVDKNDILNDRLKRYGKKITALSKRYGQALDKLVMDFFVAGFGSTLGVCYDGQYLFDTDHKYSSASTTQQSNLQTGVLSATTFEAAIEKMSLFTDDTGTPIQTNPNLLVVGPKNLQTAKKLVKQRTLASGEENIHEGDMQIVMHPRITDTKWWIQESQASAVLLQIKRDLEFLSVEEGMHAFMTGQYVYGIEAEFGAAYGAWWQCCGGLGT